MRIIEGGYDDIPLRGPWSRRENVPPENAPSPESSRQYQDTYRDTGDQNEDVPLAGPWNRQRVPDRPEPIQKEDASEWRERIEYQTIPSNREQNLNAQPAPPTGEKTDHSDGRERAGVHADHKNENPISSSGVQVRDLFSPAGIYRGLILAEILGPRGGRRGRGRFG